MLTLPKSVQELKVGRQVLAHELLAGLIMAIVTIPSGLAGEVLARLHPVALDRRACTDRSGARSDSSGDRVAHWILSCQDLTRNFTLKPAAGV